jgi:hypothetical protein
MNNLTFINQEQLSTIELLPSCFQKHQALLGPVENGSEMLNFLAAISEQRHVYLIYGVIDSSSRSSAIKNKLGAVGIGGDYALAKWRKWTKKLTIGSDSFCLDLILINKNNAHDIVTAIIRSRPLQLFSTFIVLNTKQDNDQLLEEMYAKAVDILRVRSEDGGYCTPHCWKNAITSFLKAQIEMGDAAVMLAKDQLREIVYFLILFKDDLPISYNLVSQVDVQISKDLILRF